MLDNQKIRKLKRGELAGYAFAGVCAVSLAFLIAGLIAANVLGLAAFKLAVLIAAPVVTAISAAASAYCNLRYGGALEKEISAYARGVLVENAALLHPERDSLTFTVTTEDSSALIKVNGYKEKIVFDFSALGGLSALRRASLTSVITSQLSVAFCRLAERGAVYKSVECIAGGKKPVKIIENGAPDKKIYREYLKTK